MSASFTYAILDWARSKPAGETYDYTAAHDCVICRFLRETGRASDPLVVPHYWYDHATDQRHIYDLRLDTAARGDLEEDSWTYGAFADRVAERLSS